MMKLYEFPMFRNLSVMFFSLYVIREGYPVNFTFGSRHLSSILKRLLLLSALWRRMRLRFKSVVMPTILVNGVRGWRGQRIHPHCLSSFVRSVGNDLKSYGASESFSTSLKRLTQVLFRFRTRF